MRIRHDRNSGFSLLELILVLGVGVSVSFMKFQDMKNEQDNVIASAVGQQIKQMGEAVNGYINIRYDKLSTLVNAAGNGTDPGPRSCLGVVCEITYQTLVNEGLMPSSYTGINAKKSSYKIILRRDGTAPNYVINGIIATSSAWIEGSSIRYDLLGKAMQTAGIDSGMTKINTSASGYGGQWNEISSNFNNITTAGQLVFRVGFNSALYSIYLRRDGTLPMTGNLNMGNQSIYNTQNITASGTITTGTLLSTGTTTVGTDLAVGGGANIHGNAQVDGALNSNNTISAANISSRAETYTQNWFRTMGDGGIYFQKWGGGWNMNDANTITAYGGKNIQTTAGIYGGYIKSTGNIDANGTVNAGYVWASGNLNSNYVHSNGNIDAGGQIYGAGGVVSGGRITAGEFVQINGVANIGWACGPNGILGRAVDGTSLSCVNGIWKSGASNVRIAYGSDSALRWPNAYAYCPAGTTLVGGGGSCSSDAGIGWVHMVGSHPINNNVWRAFCDTEKGQYVTAQAWAICM